MIKQKKIISLILSVIMLFSVVSAAEVSVIAEDDILNYLTYEINDGEVTITGCKRDDYGYGLIAGDVILPDTVNGYPVTSIGDGVFDGCDITSIIIPETVRTIGKHVFTMNYRLKNITIPKNVKSIDPTFIFESGVNKITVDEDNAYFSNDEFGVLFNKDKTKLIRCPENLELTEYSIPESVKIVGYHAFAQCLDIGNVSIPNGVTTIEDEAFYSSGHKSITIPESVKIIGNEAFAQCNIRSITIPESVTSMGDHVFWLNSYLESIIILNPDLIMGRELFSRGPGYTITKIYGYADSTAEAYAKEYNYPFVVLDDEDTDCTNHSYGEWVTESAATCTTNGLKKRTCSVCKTFETEEIEATGHSHKSEVTTFATHLTTGVMTYTCTCGDTYTEIIEKTTEHTFNAVVTAPTCTEQGYTTYTCACGSSYIEDYVSKKGHKDQNDDRICDTCESDYSEYTCFCACHCENSFISFFYKIIRFIRMLLGLNYCRYCDCPYV